MTLDSTPFYHIGEHNHPPLILEGGTNHGGHAKTTHGATTSRATAASERFASLQPEDDSLSHASSLGPIGALGAVGAMGAGGAMVGAEGGIEEGLPAIDMHHRHHPPPGLEGGGAPGGRLWGLAMGGLAEALSEGLLSPGAPPQSNPRHAVHWGHRALFGGTNTEVRMLKFPFFDPRQRGNSD